MKKIFIFFGCLLLSKVAFAECPSKVTLHVQSFNYSGPFNIELRIGSRPGSKIVRTKSLIGKGSLEFSDICAGSYFFALGTPDSKQVSVTQYFNVINDGYSYSNPVITIRYTRSMSDGHRIEPTMRGDL